MIFFFGGQKILTIILFRTSQHGDYWQVLGNDNTLREYGRLLQQWIHAFITSLDNDPAVHYNFPFTKEQKKLAKKLKSGLMLSSGEDCQLILHQLVKSILLFESTQSGPCNKWDSMFECMIAISALKQDGNFKQGREVTHIFAQIAYLIRSCILYEATINVDNFDGNLYRYVGYIAV